MKKILEVYYPRAKKVRLVCDNLNTHTGGALYQAFPAAVAKSLCDRLEFIVPHCDPTVNLYDRIYAMRGDRVEGVWAILGRKEVVK